MNTLKCFDLAYILNIYIFFLVKKCYVFEKVSFFLCKRDMTFFFFLHPSTYSKQSAPPMHWPDCSEVVGLYSGHFEDDSDTARIRKLLFLFKKKMKNRTTATTTTKLPEIHSSSQSLCQFCLVKLSPF